MSDTGSGVAGSIPTYGDFTAGFSAAAIEAQLTGSLDRGMNACVECCDRHAQPGRVALFWEDKDGRSTRVTSSSATKRRRRREPQWIQAAPRHNTTASEVRRRGWRL
jgi:hypothetical protein